MRILNVGDFNWMTGRERDTANVDLFPIRDKLGRAAVRAGHLVVEFSDRAVARTASPLGLKGLGRAACRRRFLQVVDEVRPELILLHFADEIDNAALVEARGLSPGVKVVDVNIDPLPSPRTRSRLLGRRGAVDALFATTAGEALRDFAGPGAFAAFMPNPVDAAVETGGALARAEPRLDLIFPAGDDSPRQLGGEPIRPSDLLARLRGRLPALRVSAPGLEGPRVRGRRYFEALDEARMGLSLSRYSDQPLYASDRMAHMLGEGLLTLVDAAVGFGAFYGPDELVAYRDLEDLLAQLERYGQDESLRRAVAEAGRRRTFELFNADRVFAYVLAQLFDQGGAKEVWPSTRWGR